ncbi:MAG: hypothetical protein AAF490_01150 [Chloroflexota bacterium]
MKELDLCPLPSGAYLLITEKEEIMHSLKGLTLKLLLTLFIVTIPIAILFNLFQNTATAKYNADQDSLRTPVFHEGGTLIGIELVDDYVISTEGGKLIIFDISDPIAPAVVGQTPQGNHTFLTIKRYGNYIYAVNTNEELITFDITTKTAPQQIASQTIVGLTDLYLEGNHLFVMHKTVEVNDVEINSGGFRIFDISTPESLVEITNYTLNLTQTFDLVQFNNYLYASVGTEDQGLRTYIFDITTINTPTLLTNWSEFTYELRIYNDSLVAVAYDGLAPALITYNLDDPTAPVRLDAADDYVIENSTLSIENDIAYVSTPFYIRVFDISDMSNITQITSNFSGGGTHSAVKNNYLFLGSQLYGLQIFEFQLNVLTSASTYRAPLFNPSELDWLDHYLYVTGGPVPYLSVLDTTNKNSPSPTAIRSAYFERYNLEFSDEYAFVSYFSGIRVYDFSDPISLTLEADVFIGYDSSHHLKLQNETLFMLDDDYLKAYDVTTPLSPTVFSQYQESTWIIEDFIVDEHYLYLAEDGDYQNPIGRLKIFEAQGNSSLQEYGSMTTTEQIDTMYLYGDILFLGHQSSISVVDVSDINDPVSINSYQLPEDINYVNSLFAKDDQLVYAANGVLSILDISDLEEIMPQETLISESSGIVALSESQGNLYVAAGHNGLIIFEDIFEFEEVLDEDYSIYLPLIIRD